MRNGSFPRAEILLACGLALALRFVYIVGVAQGPLFLHPIIDIPAGHPYGWFLSAVAGLTGNDPLALRVVQALVDAASVFLLGATAYEVWERRAALATAEVAALYGPLVYFPADLSPATFSFFLVVASLYVTVRGARAGSKVEFLLGGTALSLATLLAVAGGGAGAGSGGLVGNLALVWNRREVPCGVDQAFFGPFNSPIFRLPWLLSFWLVGPIALVAAVRQIRRAPLLTGYLVLSTLAVSLTHVCDRTRLVLLAAAIPLVGYGVDRTFAAVAKVARDARGPMAALLEGSRAYGLTLIAFVCAGALVTLPYPGIQRARSGAGWVLVARAYEAAENPRAAQRAYDSAERSGMRTSAFYADWGRLEHEKRLGILAEQHLLTAIGLDPSNAVAHETLGAVYFESERFDRAAQEYAVAAGLVPRRSAELFTRAGESFEEGGDSARAAQMFERAIVAKPGYPAAMEGLERLRRPKAAVPRAKMFPPVAARR